MAAHLVLRQPAQTLRQLGQHPRQGLGDRVIEAGGARLDGDPVAQIPLPGQRGDGRRGGLNAGRQRQVAGDRRLRYPGYAVPGVGLGGQAKQQEGQEASRGDPPLTDPGAPGWGVPADGRTRGARGQDGTVVSRLRRDLAQASGGQEEVARGIPAQVPAAPGQGLADLGFRRALRPLRGRRGRGARATPPGDAGSGCRRLQVPRPSPAAAGPHPGPSAGPAPAGQRRPGKRGSPDPGNPAAAVPRPHGGRTGPRRHSASPSSPWPPGGWRAVPSSHPAIHRGCGRRLGLRQAAVPAGWREARQATGYILLGDPSVAGQALRRQGGIHQRRALRRCLGRHLGRVAGL